MVNVEGGMGDGHCVPVLVSAGVSVVVYCFGLFVNLSDIVLRSTGSPLINGLLVASAENVTIHYRLPVSLAEWAATVWGVVYACQFLWLMFALTSFCRQTTSGPAYNNPKLLPVQVYVFFCLAVLTQVGWLAMMNRGYLTFGVLLVLLCICCALLCLCESYRAMAGAQSLLQIQDRVWDLWGIRLLAHNGLALFMCWVTLHGTLTFALFLTFKVESKMVTPAQGSLVQLGCTAALIVVYVITDLTVFDKHSRFVVLPYLSFALFDSAQLNKDWPDTHSTVFIFLTSLTAFTFLCVPIKVAVIVWRQLQQQGETAETVLVVTRPLPPQQDEQTYLLHNK